MQESASNRYEPFTSKIRKNQGNGKWLVIVSPHNLFKLGVEVNFAELGYQPLFINRTDLISDQCESIDVE